MPRRTKTRKVFDGADIAAIRKGRAALGEMALLAYNKHPVTNPLRQLRMFKELFPAVLGYFEWLQIIQKELRSQLMLETPNQNMPWDETEDRVLVDSRAGGDSIDHIAALLGRSSAACASRLSLLTGIPRSKIVEQYIEGTLDNAPVHGLFRGRAETLRRNP